MGQYYYRPVPSGYADVGRSIAAGITGGVGNYYAGKEDQRRRGVEEEDRARRRTREDLDLDVMLASAGGGRGMAPDTPTIGRPEVGSALNDRRGISAAPGPDRSRDYTQMGDFYIEDPGSRAARQQEGAYELTQSRAATERGRRGEALGTAASALLGGSRSPETLGAFYEEGMDPRMLLDDQGPQAPVMGTPEWDDAYRRRREIDRDTRPPTKWETDPDDPEDAPIALPGTIQYDRAYDIVLSMAQERNDQGMAPMTSSELISATEAFMRGEDPFGTGEEGVRAAMAGYGTPGVRGAMAGVGSSGPAAALLSPRISRPASPPVSGPEITDEVLDSIMQANPEASDDELVELVRQRR